MALSNLAARVGFAVAAIPAVLAIVYVGGLALAGLLALAAALAAWEFYRIAAAGNYAPLSAVGIALALALPFGVHFFRLGRFHPPIIALGAVVLLALFLFAVICRGPERRPLGAVASTWLGIAYTGGLLSFAYALRYHNYVVSAASGTALVAFPLVLTWTSDTAGFFVGRAFGRRKLMPAVSPGKTVEGAVGALVACVIVSVAYAQGVLPRVAQLSLTPLTAALFGIAVSVAVQIGDLVESLLKREARVKDSSHLIPGHGGVLDRVDGLLFALPTAYVIFTFPHVLLYVNR